MPSALSDLLLSMLYGGLSLTHPCALTTLTACLVILQRSQKKSSAPFFAGFTLAQLAFGSLLLFGLGSSSGKLFLDLAEMIMGPLLVLIGMTFCGLLHWKGFNLSQSRFGNFGTGALMGLQLCPSSSLFFIGVFLPITLSSEIPLFLLLSYVFGAISLIFSIHWSLKRGLRWWSALENHPLWGKGMGTLLIILGLYFSFRKGLF